MENYLDNYLDKLSTLQLFCQEMICPTEYYKMGISWSDFDKPAEQAQVEDSTHNQF